MNKKKLLSDIRVYLVYCVIGMLMGIIIYGLQAWLITETNLSVSMLAILIIISGGFGYVLARIELTNRNISICAATDPLTQLNNRLRFNEMLDREIMRSKRHGTDLSVMLVDIDSFIKINKGYGRKAADDVLMRVATIVKAVSRDVDVCARWDGDAFIVLLPDTKIAGAKIVAERMRKMVEEEFIPVVGQVTVSLGVTQFQPQKDLKETFIDRADGALYRVKKKGRNGVEVDPGNGTP